MTIRVFASESKRAGRYYLAAAIVEPAALRPARQALRALRLPGQREIHFRKEKPERQGMIMDAIARLPIEVAVYHGECVRREEPVRQECLSRLAIHLLERNAHRLVIDSRQERDSHDTQTLRRLLRSQPHECRVRYVHTPRTSDALLWIADATAWCYGMGGDWKRRIRPIMGGREDIDQP
jgi:hypothetical protein